MKRTFGLFLAFSLCCIVLVLLGGCNGARSDALNSVGPGPNGFMIKTLVRGSRHRAYGLFVPENYTASKQYPVIIFLHGLGEGGNDAHANLKVGLAPFVYDRRKDFPFICIFPQSPTGGWSEDSESATDVIAELDDVALHYSVDKDRVCLTGLSTGGYGTWAIGAKYKDRFAALAPMGSASADTKDVQRLTDMPVMSYHNLFDMFAGAWNDSIMVGQINAAGGRAGYKEFFAIGHDCWERVYADGSLFKWMEGQNRVARGGGMGRGEITASVDRRTPPASVVPVKSVLTQRAAPVVAAPVVTSPPPAPVARPVASAAPVRQVSPAVRTSAAPAYHAVIPSASAYPPAAPIQPAAFRSTPVSGGNIPLIPTPY